MPTRIQEETSNSKDNKNSSVPTKELETKNTSKEMQTTKDQHKSNSDIEIRNETNQNTPNNKFANTENIHNIQNSNNTNNVIEKPTKHLNVHCNDSSQMTELLVEKKFLQTVVAVE